MERYLKPITKPSIKKISEQMENYFYRINKKDGKYEIGYFIKIKDKDKNYLALITNSNVLDDIDNNSLKIVIENVPKLIELGNIRYEDKKYRKAIIEIKNNKSYLALLISPNVLEDIDNNSLKITIDDEPKSIELGDIIYENKVFNKAVIEIKDKSNIKYFFEID